MPADLFAYTGTDTRQYPHYLDADTGRMLTSYPGGTYRIRSQNGEPVPPTDGRWQAVVSDPPPKPARAAKETPKASGPAAEGASES